MQLLPAVQLRDYIKHYLWVQKSPAVDGRLHIFGDGNPGIAICCEGRLYRDASLQLPLPSIFGYGQINTLQTIYAPENVHLLIAVLQPYALSALLRTSAVSLANEVIDEQQLFGSISREETLHLMQCKTLSTRIEALNVLMCKLFSGQTCANQLLVAATVDYIGKMKGQISSPQLVRFTGYSERYLEKMFKEHVGLSPIKYARIMRMLNYIKSLQISNQAVTLTEHAYEAGFFDQAHLNHGFKKLTGMTPSAFSSQRQPLALNFFTVRQN